MNANAWTREFGEDCCPAKPAQSHPLGNVGDVNSPEAKCEGIDFELLTTRHRNICSFGIVLAWRVNLNPSCLAESLRPSPSLCLYMSVLIIASHGPTMFKQLDHLCMHASSLVTVFSLADFQLAPEPSASSTSKRGRVPALKDGKAGETARFSVCFNKLKGTLSIRDNLSESSGSIVSIDFGLSEDVFPPSSQKIVVPCGPQWHHKVLLVFSVILSRPSVHTEWGAVFDKQQLVSTGVELRDEMRVDAIFCPTTLEELER